MASHEVRDKGYKVRNRHKRKYKLLWQTAPIPIHQDIVDRTDTSGFMVLHSKPKRSPAE